MPKKQPELKYQREPDARTIRVAGGTVVNLYQMGDAELLGSKFAAEYPRKDEDAHITGNWTFDSIQGLVENAAFAKNTISSISGSLLIAKATGILAVDLVLPDDVTAGDRFTIIVADPPDGGYVFANGDRCRLQRAVPASLYPSVYETWFTVDNRQDVGDGTQMYEGNWRTGDDNVTYTAGCVVVDYGASGQGFITLTADAANAPYLNVSTHAGSPWSTTTTRVHIGNMNGQFGVTSAVYGLGAGDYAGGNYLRYETTGGFRIVAGAGVCSIDTNGYRAILSTAWSNTRSYQVVTSGGDVRGGFGGWESGGILYLDVRGTSPSSTDCYININGDTTDAGDDTQITLTASRASGNICQLSVASVSTGNTVAVTGGYFLTNDDVRIGGGLYVGSTATDPDTDCIHMDGSIKKSTALGARVYNSGAQTIGTAAWTSLTFDSERFDNDTIHSTVSNTSRLTCQTAGVYIIVGNIAFDANATGTRLLRIYLNNSTIIASSGPEIGNAAWSTRINITTQYDLSVSDYVELQVYQASGGDLDILSSSNYSPEFMMVRIA